MGTLDIEESVRETRCRIKSKLFILANMVFVI